MVFPMLTIALKEYKIYVTTPMCYVLLACFMCLTGFFFYQYTLDYHLQFLHMQNLQVQDALEHMNLTDWVVSPLFLQTAMLFVCITPLLTMRLVAEEKKLHTIDMLMAAPIHTYDIVLGKYLAAMTMVLLMLATLLFFPFLLHIYGATYSNVSPVDWNTVACASMGLFLCASTCVALGVLTSCLTESQMVSSMLAFALCVLLYTCDRIGADPSSFTTQLTQHLSLQTHLYSFIEGTLKSTDLCYYISFTALVLYTSTHVLENQRWQG